MTSIEYTDARFEEAGRIEEVYKTMIDTKNETSNKVKQKPLNQRFPEIKAREDRMVKDLESKGKIILNVNSELITKRRYKRRLAKLKAKQIIK